jgi:protocatechuate 3,4-dioxygenase beta subunit
MYTSILFAIFLSLIQLTSCAQAHTEDQAKKNKTERKVGGGCEGCEAIFESPVPFSNLNETDTLPDFTLPGPKIEISGTIFKKDGKTPAAGVVLYVYHTDQAGLYSTGNNPKGWEKRHGSLRGWIKTNAKGEYRFFTLIPASYPNSNNPKHIHPTIKEEGLSEYWIDEFVFANDPLLPESEKTRPNPVAGSGVLSPVMKDGMLRAKRDIILGLNVRDYPE